MERTERPRAARRRHGAGGVVATGLLLVLLLPLLLVACGETPVAPVEPPAPVEEGAPTPTEPSPSPMAPLPGQLAGRLLFIRGGNIWVWANGQPAQLTTDGGYLQPRWSPDGTAMLYLRRGESYIDLWQADSAAQQGRRLTNNKAVGLVPESKEYVEGSFLVGSPTWARTASGGDRIVYSTDRDDSVFKLWVLNGLGGKPAPIYGTQALAAHQEGATLSPDGGRVAFTADVIDEKTGTRATQIFVVDVNTGSYRALTSEANGAYDAAWSPDGKWLAYAVRKGRGENTSIWAMRADGSGRLRLTDGGKDRGASWAPDGTRLAFARSLGSGFALFSVGLDTTGGAIVAGKPERIGDFADVDPASGVGWAR